jgi:hypothetical protein
VSKKPRAEDDAREDLAYFEGHRRIPDGDDPDFIAMEKVGLEDAPWADEEWPEAPDDEPPAARTSYDDRARPL